MQARATSVITGWASSGILHTDSGVKPPAIRSYQCCTGCLSAGFLWYAATHVGISYKTIPAAHTSASGRTKVGMRLNSIPVAAKLILI